MKTQVSVPQGFSERLVQRSAIVVRSGFRNRGVIFTSSDNPSPDDFGPDPSHLVGAFIHDIKNRAGNADPFFEILGGYFFDVDASGGPVTKKVFGVVKFKTNEFEITEGGSNTIATHWSNQFSNNSKVGLDETELPGGKNPQPNRGWTFVVVPKPGKHSFPCDSELGMATEKVCASFTRLSLAPGSMSSTSMEVIATAEFTGNKPNAFKWDWGDGSAVEETTDPQRTHTYTLTPGVETEFTVLVSYDDGDGCSDSISDKIGGSGPCPAILQHLCTQKDLDDQFTEVEITLKLDPDKGAPGEYEWDWGDGSAKEITKEPKAVHNYERAYDGEKSYHVQVVAKGPQSCEVVRHMQKDIPQRPCPTITKVESLSSELDASTQTHTFKAEVTKGGFGQYEWTFEGETAVVKTDVPEVTHAFPRPSGDAEKRKVTVTGLGIAPCPATAETEVEIPGVCPTLSIHNIRIEPFDETDTSVTVKATLNISGDAPDTCTWNWGDGSAPDVTAETEVSHVFSRPAGDADGFIIKVTANGPDTCSADAEGKVLIPGICPLVTEISYSLGKTDATTQRVKFEAVTFGPAPDSYEWDFGDGTPVFTSKTAEVSNVYQGIPGKNQEFKVTVTTSGPESCSGDSVEVVVKIPAFPCPIIGASTYELGSNDGTKQEVIVSFDLSAPAPEKLTWDWGDNTTSTSDQPSSTHFYDIPVGQDKIYTITLTVEGPGECGKTVGKIPVEIPGVCPVIGDIDVGYAEVEKGAKTQSVAFTLPAEPGTPEAFEWDFGDGSKPVVTDTPHVNHSYEIRLGGERIYNVIVLTKGPGECSGHAKTKVQIQGVCPKLGELSIKLEEVTTNTKVVTMEVALEAYSFEKYEWDWGDSSEKEITDQPTASHTYERPSDADHVYPVTVTGIGPDPCKDSAGTEVTVPHKPCPAITQIKKELLGDDGTSCTLKFTLELAKGTPEKYVWSFGDGSGDVETTVPEVTHTFPRLESGNETYLVEVNASGPGDCATWQDTEVVIPGLPRVACPEVKLVQVISAKKISADKLEVKLRATVDPAGTEKYVWNFGDESPEETTTTHEVTHIYFRSDVKDQLCQAKVTVHGPGDCSDSGIVAVEVPKADVVVPPLFCRLLPYITAFLAALFIGICLVCAAFEMTEAQEDDTWVIIITALSLLLFGVAVILWLRVGKEHNCAPNRCNWLAVGWTAMLTALAVTFFMLDCFSAWVPLAIIFFVLFAFLAYLWFKNCALESRARELFTYVIIALIAFFIVSFAVAAPLLTCCQ